MNAPSIFRLVLVASLVLVGVALGALPAYAQG
jgi:hypothetical protein